jgi:tripartite-type tricarboxylate transporter receptor subunit TctC
MKRLTALLLALGMMCTMAACGAKEETPAAPAAPAASAPVEEGYDYPVDAITMIVPYGAGGTTDVVGRQFAVALSKVLDVDIVVENQAGASGSIGCQAALDADTDGSVVLFTAESLGTQRVMGISELSYANYKPIAAVANDPKVIVVNGNSKYNTIDELLADIQANPGTIQMSYTGPGGSGHVQALIMNQFGYEPALTAYSSGSDCYVAVMGDQVVFTNSNYSTVASYIENGDLKLLAVAATERMADFPDVPALSEVMEGSEDYLSIPYTPLSMLVSAEMDDAIVETLRAACAEAAQDPDFEAFMEANSVDKLYEKYTTVDEMNAFSSEWESTVSWLLYDAGAAAYSPEDFGIAKIG